MKKNLILSLVLIVFVLSPLLINGADTKTIIMCRPLISQIKNIVVMQELGILPVEKMELICVYHEDELTSYKSSEKYVKSKNLSWVKFKKIKGKVAEKNLFKKNLWTTTFIDIIKNSDGIIFTGGMDIPASIYGEKNSLLTAPYTPVRSYYEISFLFHLIGRENKSGFIPILENNKDYPVLAICLGEQSLNIAAGGTLVQDIPSEIYNIKYIEDVLEQNQDNIHRINYLKALNPGVKKLFSHFHKIKFIGGEIFKRIGIDIENTPYVISAHHQAADKIGNGLRVIATSMDGKIVEALEHKRYKNVLGVQFHPEVYKLYEKNKFFRKTPSGELKFSPYEFLTNNKNSMKFHKKIWKWFAESL